MRWWQLRLIHSKVHLRHHFGRVFWRKALRIQLVDEEGAVVPGGEEVVAVGGGGHFVYWPLVRDYLGQAVLGVRVHEELDGAGVGPAHKRIHPRFLMPQIPRLRQLPRPNIELLPLHHPIIHINNLELHLLPVSPCNAHLPFIRLLFVRTGRAPSRSRVFRPFLNKVNALKEELFPFVFRLLNRALNNGEGGKLKPLDLTRGGYNSHSFVQICKTQIDYLCPIPSDSITDLLHSVGIEGTDAVLVDDH